jgi:DNA-binding response OmpR family regulator
MRFSVQKDGDYLPVDEFMEKPIRLDPLLEMIRKLLQRRNEKAPPPG